MKRLIVVSLLLAVAVGCTDQSVARSFGGTAKVNLAKNEKLVTITWKDHNLWYLTRPMRDDEKPETYTFHESSSYGAMQGTVVITEMR